jgi:hypothetical protein
MFITENQSIAESILFLLSARESLSCMVEASSVDHKDALKNFLMNEASDYEIIYMLMHEEMPAEKYNFANEIRLFSDLKEQVLVNYNTLGEYMGESVQTFINEVDTVYPDFSSAVPVLEFQLASENTLNEADPGAYLKKGRELGTTIVGKAKKGLEVLAAIKAKAIAAAPALQKAVTSQAGMAVGGAALAALALYASVKLYKRFMSKAAKSCAGQSGSAKTICMKKYQHSAIAAQIKDLGSAINVCAKSKSPEKCKIPIQKKISNLQVKMQKMKAKMVA